MKKKLNLTITIGITMASLLGCASGGSVAPSQNESLNKVSPSGKDTKTGIMQSTMEKWFEEDWDPTVKQDQEIQKKYMKEKHITTHDKDGNVVEKVVYEEDKERNFTLQEYVDKAAAYQRAHPSDYEHSNVKKLESLPVIGK